MEENKDIIDEVNIEEENYKVNISDEVVATIAGIAAAEIEGVADMSGGVVGGIAERLGAKKSPQKGVKVDVTPDGAVIDLYIIVDFGVRIPELAWEIQENVKTTAVNEDLDDSPEAINEDAYAAWIVEVKVTDGLDDLISAADYEAGLED